VVAQLLVFAGWVTVNAGKIPWIAPFDPFPYPLLSSMTSLEAVLLAAFVLMKQNRLGVIADRRDHLDLQVNLLTERRVTQIIQMLDQLSRHFGIEPHQDQESRELGWVSLSQSSTWSRRCTADYQTREDAGTFLRALRSTWS
jgi:uncharacterized membrane protein